ncbi:MAG: imidazole glycerol phosphate synthase subunit HisF [Anaerolineales bacterium]|nr:imidazole glycerol phosphate synthase subunit HisF [Anaerolineales bacterium]MCB9126489.1 imidazole glycerol phosphate synthase subunit HisF [Ardenticatenales bacterium]
MLATRIIPCLDIHDGRVVKGVKFKALRDAGDPVTLAAYYNAQRADELIFLDIGASYRSQALLIEVVEAISRQVFIPLTVGGGIRTIDDMRKALQAGADKVATCTAAIQRPALLSEGAERFGSQCIVLSIDAKQAGDSWVACTHGGRQATELDAIEWAMAAERLGAGEILLNSIDRDGTRDGYDLELTRRVSEAVRIPVIASGGAGTLDHLVEAVAVGRADALLLASLFHFGELTVDQVKAHLQAQGIPVRRG